MFRLASAGSTLKLAVAALAVAAALAFVPAAAQAALPAPTGVTAIALNGQVTVAWQPVSGASGYAVYRGTSATSINQLVSSSSIGATRFTDPNATNGTAYFYAVRTQQTLQADSSPSAPVRATALARSCASGNAVVVENCYTGSTGWKLAQGARAYDDGIEGFASASSINQGGSVNLRVNTNEENVPYRIDIYRTGWYGGAQGRLISTLPNLRSVWQPGCDDGSSLGLIDCSDWEVTSTITTTTDWVSGVYLLRLVREDNGEQNEILLTVRRDGSNSEVAYSVPDTTYQAYNNFGGKSLYSSTSTNRERARKVSFDRPYSQPTFAGDDRYDWYTRTDVETVGWLERNGYDVTYTTDTDLHANGAQAASHDVLMLGSHDEYWSTAMVNAATAARDAGTSLMFMGANSVYWKIRFENSPSTGQANRVQVTYKSVESGPVDPVEPTSTWRDPNGGNRPENGLVGVMYIGDNDNRFFPLQVSAAEGKNRFWRHTSLASLAAGTTASVGSTLVGWEWDARVANGREPSGLQVLASSPVTGQLVQGNGGSYVPNATAVAQTSLYRAASGAWVFASGTNHWSRGLGRNADNVGEPDARIQQATMNMLSDGGARPTTPAADMVLDPSGAPTVTSTTPAAGATGVAPNAALRAVFSTEMDPATLNASTFRVLRGDGSAVPGTVTLDNATRTATLTLGEALDPFATYTARVETGAKSWNGTALAGARVWTFTTGAGTPPTVTSRTPAPNATGVPIDTAVSAVFDRRLDPASVTGQTATLTNAPGQGVAATVTYDDATRTVRITPNARLNGGVQYTATLTTGISASDGSPLAAPVTWTFTTGTAFTIAGRTPNAGATGVAPNATVRATFSRDADPATITSSSFRLTNPSGSAIAAQVSYDAATRTATLAPNQALALSTQYTATVTTAVRAADGGPLDQAATWSFTTAASPPPAPVATTLSPVANAAGAPISTTVRATFDRALDEATVTTQSFTLTPQGSSTPLTAAVAYDGASNTATLTPGAALTTGTTYTARLTTAIRSSAGTPLAATVQWSFTTADCPCSLMSSLTPDVTGNPVADGRTGPGPYTYELGTEIAVDTPTNLIALKFYKDPGETGTHIGRVWSSSGTQLAQVTFQNESGSGWQRQALASALTLQPGQTYVVSVGLNSRYDVTQSGLQNQLVAGPLRSVADGTNGVYNASAGNFPTSSYRSSNYFVDAVVVLPGRPPRTPAVAATSPVSGASGVTTAIRPTARFNLPLDGSTVSASTFTLRTAAGQSVAATVSYDEATQTATLRPSAPLATGTTYTATVSTGVRSDDETPMAAPYSWSFSTSASAAPVVTATSPTDGAAQVGLGFPVTATFTAALDPATVNANTFKLTGPGGTAVPATVSYASATNTATLTPTQPLNGSTTYTATLTTGVRSSAGVAIERQEQWSFSTNACPCRLFASTLTPATVGLDTRDGRSGGGPFSYELGVKITVSKPAELMAIRYWKDPGETGSHVGKLWSASGTLLATQTFSGETGSGWQEQAMATPVALAPGTTYIVSVNANAFFVSTTQGLSDPITSGPLASVAGANGVFAESAGALPTGSWRSSNYFVDAVVR